MTYRRNRSNVSAGFEWSFKIEVAFIFSKNKTEDERQADILRLNGLGNGMGSELKNWVKERTIRILKQSVSDEKMEL